VRRREFIAGLGSVTAWPVAARAQQAGKLPIIGLIGLANDAQSGRYAAAFSQRLRELGWLEGRTVEIQYRWTNGDVERAAEFAAEFVPLKVNVIVTSGNEDSLVVKRVTSTIPIVFAIAGDPVGTGLVASLARPGGNVTGLSNQLTDAAGKRVQLLYQIVPGLRRLAIMANVNPLSDLERAQAEEAAKKLGLDTTILEIRQREDIPRGFETIKDRADALYVANSGFLAANRLRIIISALSARLPTVFGSRGWVDSGGLISYGSDFAARYRRTADLVDKILRGTKPADIPVEQPTKLDLVVNLITAKTLGLTIPETLLATADEVIQ
jgi:putative tryptophan/tyrosine transport system substrate-binding protein